MNPNEISRRIAHALGIDPWRVVGFEVRCWVDEMPRVTVTRNILDAHSITEQTDVFELSLRTPQPFDLNRACYDAIKRLRAAVDDAWMDAQDAMNLSYEKRLREIWQQ